MMANVLMNWIAAVGLFGLLLCLRQIREDSAASQRIIWLTFGASLFFGWRALSWATGAEFLKGVELILAAILPMLMLLATEAVLRRHALSYVKYVIAAVPLIVVLSVLIGHGRFEPWFSYLLIGVQAAAIIFCIGWLLLRDRRDRSDAENRTADIFTFALVLAGAFFLTDFRLILDAPVRFGALGFLMAAYVIVSELSPQQTSSKLAKEAIAVFSVSVILTLLALSAFGVTDAVGLLQLFGLSLTLFLTAIILLRYFGLRVDRRANVSRHLLEADTGSLDRFLSHALKSPDVHDARLVTADMLQDFDVETITQLLQRVPVYSRYARIDEDLASQHAAAIDQLESLLEYRGATHAARIDSQPASILLASAPTLGERSDIEIYLALVSKMTTMISDQDIRADYD